MARLRVESAEADEFYLDTRCTLLRTELAMMRGNLEIAVLRDNVQGAENTGATIAYLKRREADACRE